MVGLVEVTVDDVVSGEWLQKTLHHWRQGQTYPISVTPKPSGDKRIVEAVKGMLDSNGTYANGDRAVIHARANALPMAGDAAIVLAERGIPSTILLRLFDFDYALHELLGTVYDSIGSGTDKRRLSAFPDSYHKLIEELRGNGHWIVTLNSEGEKRDKYKDVLALFKDVFSEAIRPMTELRDSGNLKSHDI